MKLIEIIGYSTMNRCHEDHSGCEYARIADGGELGIYVSGYYTQAELEMKLTALKEAEHLRKNRLD